MTHELTLADRARLPVLTARGAVAERTVISVARAGADIRIGGRAVVVAAGPCAVENREMLLSTARAVRSAGAVMLRGGAFKPRTSPYSFQGMGADALALLSEARELTGLSIITEVLDPRHVELVANHADALQVGARNMQNFALLAEVGRSAKPVLLKRGMSATLDELLMAAEHIMAGGNSRVILCERGIRTFETKTRNTLDVAAIPVLKRETHLPVFVDPSHAGGRAHLVSPLSLAAIAAGADGLIIEVHPSPAAALSDGEQSLPPRAFATLVRQIAVVAGAVGREIDVGRPEARADDGGAEPNEEVDGTDEVTDLAGLALPVLLDTLVGVRDDIQTVDREIISLLARRVALGRRAGRVKRAAGVSIVDPMQEAAVLERARELAEAAGLPYRDLRALLRGMIAISRRAQLNDEAADEAESR
ncbi:MAG TPA: 3-deoxy-7-phosphoheptulonate synthase [Gemmatimonadaceae bacterium]